MLKVCAAVAAVAAAAAVSVAVAAAVAVAVAALDLFSLAEQMRCHCQESGCQFLVTVASVPAAAAVAVAAALQKPVTAADSACHSTVRTVEDKGRMFAEDTIDSLCPSQDLLKRPKSKGFWAGHH